MLALVVRQGARLAAVGIALGVPGAGAATRVFRQMLFGVSATAPVGFAGVAALLAAVALAASYFPARRAAQVDPVIALRAE